MLTIELKDILIIVAIILAIYLIVAAYNLIKTLKQSQKVLSDFEIVAKTASARTQQLDKLIDSAASKVKAGQGVVNSIPVIIAAISNIAKVVGQQNAKKTDKEK